MSLERARSVVAKLCSAWTTADREALRGIVSADCEWIEEGPQGARFYGRDALLARFVELQEEATHERSLLDMVAGPGGFAAFGERQSTDRQSGITSAGAWFDLFTLNGEQIQTRQPFPYRSNLLAAAGIHGPDRREALIVRDWADPRVSRFETEHSLVGRKMRYQRYLDDNYVNCAVTIWRSISNVESQKYHRSGYVALHPETGAATDVWVSEESFDECRKLFEWEVVPTPPDAV